MGGRGTKRKKNEPSKPKQKPQVPKQPEGVPKIPKKKKKDGGLGFGGGGSLPQQPQEEPKKEKPKAPEFEGKTLRIGGLYFKLQNGKLTKIGSSYSYEFENGKVTVKIGSKEFEVDEKGNYRELPKKEKKKDDDDSVTTKLRKFMEDYVPTTSSVRLRDDSRDRMKTVKAQARESVEMFKKAGIELPTHEQMVKAFMSAGLNRRNAEEFAGDHNYLSSPVHTNSSKGGRQAQERMYLEDAEVQQGVKLQAYVLSQTIGKLKSDLLNEDMLKDFSVVNKFRVYNTSPSVGGGMDGQNTYYIPLNRVGLSKFENAKGNVETFNVDFTLQGVAVHETGHALNNIIRRNNPSLQSDFNLAVDRLNLFGLLPSNYSAMSKEEFFAEAFLGYIKYKHWKQPSHMNTVGATLVDRPKYDVNNPIYDIMDAILKHSGLLKGYSPQRGGLDVDAHIKVNEYIFSKVKDWDVKVVKSTDPSTGATVYVESPNGKPLKELYSRMYEKYGRK